MEKFRSSISNGATPIYMYFTHKLINLISTYTYIQYLMKIDSYMLID